MNLAEAKELIAAYLSGRHRVAQEELSFALATVRTDAPYLRFLKEELGLAARLSGACELFLARVAEFSELSRAEREQEMPELAAHVEVCAACRAVYREIRPLWHVPTAAQWETRKKELTDGLRLALVQAGQWLEEGLSLPARLTPDFALAPMTESREWVLQDKEAQCTIRLSLRNRNAYGADFGCSITSQVTATDFSLEVCYADNEELFLSVALSESGMKQRFLPWGSWLIRLEARLPDGVHLWEIPLTLRAVSHDEGDDNAHE